MLTLTTQAAWGVFTSQREGHHLASPLYPAAPTILPLDQNSLNSTHTPIRSCQLSQPLNTSRPKVLRPTLPSSPNLFSFLPSLPHLRNGAPILPDAQNHLRFSPFCHHLSVHTQSFDLWNTRTTQIQPFFSHLPSTLHFRPPTSP